MSGLRSSTWSCIPTRPGSSSSGASRPGTGQTRGLGKPETFDFLGFTHICGKTRNGRFWLRRITITKRMRAKLQARSKTELKRRRHLPIPEQGRWLASVVRGHLAYYAVPGNIDAVRAFRDQADPALARGASAPQPAAPPDLGADEPPRRPMAAACPHRASLSRACASTPGPEAGAQCGSSARWDLCGGPPARAVPTAIVGICGSRRLRCPRLPGAAGDDGEREVRRHLRVARVHTSIFVANEPAPHCSRPVTQIM